MDLPDKQDNLVLLALMAHQEMWDLEEMLVLEDSQDLPVT